MSKIKSNIEKAPKGFKLTTEGVVELESKEDGGAAMIAETFPFETDSSDDENGMFVKIQSWDEDTVHSDFIRILGKKVRITIEVLD